MPRIFGNQKFIQEAELNRPFDEDQQQGYADCLPRSLVKALTELQIIDRGHVVVLMLNTGAIIAAENFPNFLLENYPDLSHDQQKLAFTLVIDLIRFSKREARRIAHAKKFDLRGDGYGCRF